jgi:uncharacterized membrane protein
VDNPHDELEALKAQVALLTARVYQLEQNSASQKSQPTEGVEPLQRASTAPEPLSPSLIPPPGSMLVPPPIITAPGKPPTGADSANKVSPQFKLSSLSAASRERTSMEEKIGQYWLNRVGIVAILVGVSYFLKFAFDNNWIGPGGRIVIGLLAGMGLILWSERFRKRNYTTFSYSLKAVGIGIHYLSLWGAYQVYHLIPAQAAFLAMSIVTAATIALALSQNAELLASFALAGGFVTPLLLSTGENHEVVLFTYVCLLDLAILAMAIFRPWRRLLWASFVGTIILFAGWYGEYYSKYQRPLTVFFAAIFAALFAMIPLVVREEQADESKRVPVILTLLPLLNATLFFLALFVMYESETSTLTWYALPLAAVYLAIGNAFKRGAKSPKSNFIHLLHMAIAVAFLTIAIPAKLNAHWITIGWLVESGALLWVSVKTKTDFLRYLAVAALILGLTRLLFFDQLRMGTLVFNARFATYVVAIAILAAIAHYGQGHASGSEMILIKIAIIGANVLALIALTWEAADYFNRQLAAHGYRNYNYSFFHEISIARAFTYSAIWLIYGGILMACGFLKRSSFVRWQALILIALTTVKIFLYDVSELGGSYRIVSFIALGALLLAISFVYQRDWLQLSSSTSEKSETTVS